MTAARSAFSLISGDPVQRGRDVAVLNDTVVAYFQGGGSLVSLADTVAQGATGTVGAVFKVIAEAGQYRFLDMLMGAVSGRPLIGTTTSDAQFNANALGFFGQLSPAVLSTLRAEILPTDPRALASLATRDVNARAALAALSVVSLQVAPGVAARFSLYDPASGQGEITSNWITDRAAMTSWVSLGDRVPLNGGITRQAAVNSPVVYKDSSTGAVIRLTTAGGAVSVASTTFDGDATNILFGGDAADTLMGGTRADHLYGGAGNDTLSGQGGNDWLEGNADSDTLDGGAGNDTLIGGTGFDTYLFSSGFGHDTIIDADGLGALKLDGVAITGGLKVGTLNNVWEDTLGQYVYTLVPNATAATGGTDLVIGHRSAPGASTVDGTITVRNWANGQLGINLDLSQSLPTAPTTASFSGDFIKQSSAGTYTMAGGNYASAGVQLDAQDMLTGTAGADELQGLGGNDALAGDAGDDLLDGGAGSDLLLGGLGADRIQGGAGQDFIFGSGAGVLQSPTQTSFTAPLATGTEYARGFAWVVSDGGADPNGFARLMVAGADVSTRAGDSGNFIDGGAGDDFIYAGSGADVVHGGDDADSISGLGGADVLFGDAGNDKIWGDGMALAGYASSVAAAEHGNDVLVGGAGADVIWGDGLQSDVVGRAHGNFARMNATNDLSWRSLA